ncbi:MAG: hypothetical protein ACQETH_11445 [Candidatus Rifleibacteriota bacterium]
MNVFIVTEKEPGERGLATWSGYLRQQPLLENIKYVTIAYDKNMVEKSKSEV